MAARQEFAAVVANWDGRVYLPIPFDPTEAWGLKARHHVHGLVNGMGIRGVIELFGGEQGVVLGPAWRRDCGLAPGASVHVILEPEGPQRGDLAEDLATALEAAPEAGAFFDALAQFYRKGYLRWVEATKRNPSLRAARIAELIELLKAGHKERPKT